MSKDSIVKFRPFNNVECCFDIVAETGNNVEATFDTVERTVQLVAFDNVASTLLLVWTGVKDRLQTGTVDTQHEIDGTPSYVASLLESYIVLFWNCDLQIKNLLTVSKLSLALSTKAFCVSAPTV